MYTLPAKLSRAMVIGYFEGVWITFSLSLTPRASLFLGKKLRHVSFSTPHHLSWLLFGSALSLRGGEP